MAQDRAPLGEFLRARRDAITPAQAGVETYGGARRVPGLRRDELAGLAGVSSEYYSRVEQGRQRNVSPEVLGALARALRLDDVETAHLGDLASPVAQRNSGGPADLPQRPEPGLLRVMAALDHLPVLLLGHRTEVLARNALLPAVLGDEMAPGSSFVQYLFGPLARERILNWPEFASATVAAMRRETARRPWDRRLTALIDGLRADDPDAARWWDDHTVRDYASVRKVIGHPVAGTLTFDIEILEESRQPDQRIVLYTAEPGSRTARMLPLLASWGTAEPAEVPTS